MNTCLTTHFDMIVLIPTLIFSHQKCGNPECDASHFVLRFSWLFWTFETAL